MPLVSFIIPCYRQAHFLHRAVASVLAQTERDIEAIVVDDGSPDDPAAAVREFEQDRRLTLIQQENRGLALARNRGIEASSGEYLAFLDSDDWLAPEFAAELLAVLRSDPGLGFAYCDIVQLFEDQGPDTAQEQWFSVGKSRTVTSGDILPSLLCGGYFTPNTVLARSEVVKKLGGFAAELGGHADYDLWLRIAASGWSARYVDRRLAYYRIHGENMSFQHRHMEETRRMALDRLAHAFPRRFAEAANELIRLTDHLHGANLLLQEQLIEADTSTEARRREAGPATDSAAEYFRESQAWIQELQKAVDFHQDQAAYWRQQAEDRAARIIALEREQLKVDPAAGPPPSEGGAGGEP